MSEPQPLGLKIGRRRVDTMFMAELLVAREDGTLLRAVDLGGREMLTIGRSRRCELCLDAPSVSRRHALAFSWSGAWTLIDTASRTGLHAGRGRQRRIDLGPDHWVRMGPFFLWLEPGDAVVPAQEPGRLRTIGRSRSCDIRLDDPTVSRLHAVLYREGARWCVADAGSRHGTRIDGRRMHRCRLHEGAVITAGNSVVEVGGHGRHGEPLCADDEPTTRISAFIGPDHGPRPAVARAA